MYWSAFKAVHRVALGIAIFMLSVTAFSETVVKIGILSFESKSDTATRWRPTANYLESKITGHRFEVIPLNYDELNLAVKFGDVDFVLTNPEHYVVLRNTFGISPMVTLTTLIGTETVSKFGSVIFMRKEKATTGNLNDARGKRIAAVGLYSLGGFLAAADVFHQQHLDLQSNDVVSLKFTGTPHSKVVQEVMSGDADVGVVRTGVLEQMAQQGKLNLNQIQVLNIQPASQFPQLLSTPLFPEWPLAAMPKTEPDLVKRLTIALLNIPADSSFAHAGNYAGFTPPANYAGVEDLMRRLKVYPGVDTVPIWTELWLNYSVEIEISIFILFLAGAGASAYLWIANRKLYRLTLLYIDAQAGLKVMAAAFESQVGIIVTDQLTTIVRANDAFTKLFGYTERQVLGSSTSILRANIVSEGTLRKIWPILISKGYWQGELQCRHRSGSEIPCIVAITALRDDTSDITGFVGSFLDISIQKSAEREARQLAHYDPLTELPNRRLFIERLTAEIGLASEAPLLGALMFIDLDDFKALNDTYGHSVGDHLLKLVAAKLGKFVHSQMLAARLGGDEFVVMWPRINADASVALKSATALAHEIRRALLDNFELLSPDSVDDHGKSLQYKITASMGVALFGDKVEPVTEVLKRADVAMYQSKMAGKNAVSIFDQQVQSAINSRVALSTDLNSALLKGQLEVHYQLQSTTEGYAVGAECLLRWRHPVRGMVPPGEFIPIAEESCAIVEIGYWVIEQACATLARWSQIPSLASLTLSVNVSPRQFIDQDFHLRVEKFLHQAGVTANRLCLEITEGIVLNDAENVIEKMKELVKSGLSFSIDDFGTGYSSLSYLQRLPLRELKIDKSFINNLATNSNSEAIVRAIIALGLSMRIQVLAEGVETEEQQLRLKTLGCERIQGYFLARPMELDAMEKLLLR